jgi:hypothetical protein
MPSGLRDGLDAVAGDLAAQDPGGAFELAETEGQGPAPIPRL